MKISLTIFYLLLIQNILCQDIKIELVTIVNNQNIAKFDSNEYILNFSENEKNSINNSLKNHLNKNQNLYRGYIFNENNFLVNGEIDTNSQFYIEKINRESKILKQDSILIIHQANSLDENGEQMYDDEGDEMYKTVEKYYPFQSSLYKINTKEKWGYKNSVFEKIISNSGVDNKIKLEKNWTANSYLFSVSNNTNSKYRILKENIVYTHLFYPKYYSTFLNNDTIIKLPYSDKIEIGFKSSESISPLEINNFLKPILNEVHQNKVVLYQIDENNEILPIKIKAGDIKSLFYIEKDESYDEYGEHLITEDGDQIFIISRTPILLTDILGIEFHEDWYIGKNSFELKKEVKGIVLLIGDYDEDGTLIGTKRIPAYISFE